MGTGKGKAEETSCSSLLFPGRAKPGSRRGLHPRFRQHPLVPVAATAICIADGFWLFMGLEPRPVHAGSQLLLSGKADSRFPGFCPVLEPRAGLSSEKGDHGVDGSVLAWLMLLAVRPHPVRIWSGLWIGVPRSPGMTHLHIQSMRLTQIQHPAKRAHPAPSPALIPMEPM